MAKPRVLIANRGEIAVRIIRTVRELGYTSIAVYSDADRDSLHVEMADQAHRIGPALAADSYLSIGAILEAASRGKATMIHPGYGFLSERAHFARAVADSGFTFIGPPADAIEMMGDKSAARRAADRVGVPIVPGTPEPVTIEQARAEAERIGFPVLVKAAFGGGGKGMQAVRKPEELDGALARATREAQAYFGRPEVFLERYIDRAHHVEAQVFADTRGNVFFLGERDCTVQAPEAHRGDAVARGRRGAPRSDRRSGHGAREGGRIRERRHRRMHPRRGRQLLLPGDEHAVAGRAHGHLYGDGPGPGGAPDPRRARREARAKDVSPNGHAIQCRINAEDPARNFLPGPGRVTAYREPSGPFVRVDSGVRAGRGDPPRLRLDVREGDRLRGESPPRDRADGPRVVRVPGRGGHLPTTIPLHRWVLGTRAFGKSTHSTTWLEKALRDAELPEGGTPAPPPADTRQPVPAELLLEVDGRRVPVRIFDQRRDTAPKVPSRYSAHGGDHVHSVIAAPMQGTILRVLVEPRQQIQAGDVVCILEAMKMENAIPAPREGVVTEIPVQAGQNVQPGDTLVELD